MWSTLEQLFVAVAITVLKSAIKNPASVKTEGAIISAVAQAATEADTAVNGTAWTSTPAPPAAAA